MRRELNKYATWYNASRPHTHLGGRTPQQAFDGLAAPKRRFEPRLRMPSRGAARCDRLALVIECLGDRRHLPVIALKRIA
jgi:hypothetical protein